MRVAAITACVKVVSRLFVSVTLITFGFAPRNSSVDVSLVSERRSDGARDPNDSLTRL